MGKMICIPQRVKKLKIDRTALKIIAIFTMLIDHIGFILFPDVKVLRWIGRLAFPIFVYQLVEGFEKTSNIKKYFFRLLLFAFISEIPFDLAFFGTPFYWEYQNVYFELCFILLGLILLKKAENSSDVLRFFIVFSISLGSLITKTDYGAFGVLLAFIFYQYKNNFLIYAVSLATLSVVFVNTSELFSLLSLPLIILYKRGGFQNRVHISKPIQHLFYWFYPLHITVLVVIKNFVYR